MITRAFCGTPQTPPEALLDWVFCARLPQHVGKVLAAAMSLDAESAEARALEAASLAALGDDSDVVRKAARGLLRSLLQLLPPARVLVERFDTEPLSDSSAR